MEILNNIFSLNTTALTIPLYSLYSIKEHKLCKSVFQYMELAGLTVAVNLDNTFFSSLLFSDWGF